LDTLNGGVNVPEIMTRYEDEEEANIVLEVLDQIVDAHRKV
jgi:hypothetical protein